MLPHWLAEGLIAHCMLFMTLTVFQNFFAIIWAELGHVIFFALTYNKKSVWFLWFLYLLMWLSAGAWDSLAILKREFLFLIALVTTLLNQGSEGLALDSLWGIDISIICRKSNFQFDGYVDIFYVQLFIPAPLHEKNLLKHSTIWIRRRKSFFFS